MAKIPSKKPYTDSQTLKKFNQFASFCLMVECDNSVEEAAKRQHLPTIEFSKRISALQRDLDFRLFDRVNGELILTKEGKDYYDQIKQPLINLDKACGRRMDIRNLGEALKLKTEVKRKKTLDKYKKYFRDFFDKLRFYLNKFFRKMLVKITVKRFLVTLSIVIFGVYIYLHSMNYFFDKKLESLANPLLKQVMRDGSYRVDKNIPCEQNIDATVFCMDINKLLLSLAKERSDVSVAMIKVTELVSTPMRMSDDHKKNEIFNNDKEITCDRERRFDWLKERHDNKMSLLQNNKNAKFYLFYEKNDGTNYDVMLENIKKYPDQLFDMRIKKLPFYLNRGTYWIIKNNNYYYMMYETNGVSSHHQHEVGERYLIFKKFTRDELMNHDNGSYGKLIREYGIKID